MAKKKNKITPEECRFNIDNVNYCFVAPNIKVQLPDSTYKTYTAIELVETKEGKYVHPEVLIQLANSKSGAIKVIEIEEEKEVSDMTLAELKAYLDAAKVKYDKNALKKDLIALAEAIEKEGGE